MEIQSLVDEIVRKNIFSWKIFKCQGNNIIQGSNLGNCKCWAPLFFKNVKTYASIAIDVRVKHLSPECNLQYLVNRFLSASQIRLDYHQGKEYSMTFSFKKDQGNPTTVNTWSIIIYLHAKSYSTQDSIMLKKVTYRSTSNLKYLTRNTSNDIGFWKKRRRQLKSYRDMKIDIPQDYQLK